MLNVVPGTQRASKTLTAAGLAGIAPTAVADWVDWADLPPGQARVGPAHAASNAATAPQTSRLHPSSPSKP
ncbi:MULTISPECIES: hypothetical protein [unclassified Streptomyces]|uniref:hypothetical protein n=1 Tax=unclassified Streptomyces TaxID=2593676 RepID=UPI00382EF320